MPDEGPRHGPNVNFTGSKAARKRLESAKLACLHIEIYRAHSYTWEAMTNDGPRWVSWSQDGGWKISKTPPNGGRRAA